MSKNEISVKTFPQKELNYVTSGKNVGFDGFSPEVSVYDQYTDNNIKIWYYAEPIFHEPYPKEVPANQEQYLRIKTDFKWEINHKDRIMTHGNFTCRFMSLDGKRVVYTNATVMSYPLDDANADPNTLSCKSPKWDLINNKTEEEVKLDITINGFDYSGDQRIIITENLNIYKIVPLCGPNEGGTRVKIIGTGLRAAEDISVKWGVV